MRTRAAMITRVRNFISDIAVTVQSHDDPSIAESLEEAAETLWNSILAHKSARKILLKAQSPQNFIDNIDVYPIPSDSLRLRRVEVRRLTTKQATLTCGATGDVDPAFWALIANGSFRYFADDTNYEITGIDFSTVSVIADAATIIQAAIRAVTNGSEEVTFVTDHFEFKSFNRILHLEAVLFSPVGTDISPSTHLNGRRPAAVPTVALAINDWFKIPMAVDRSDFGSVRSGNRAQFSSITHGGAITQAFWDETAEGFLEIHDSARANEGVFRIWYYHRPAFPSGDNDTIPLRKEGVDTMVEYLASALISLEDLEDGKPIGVFGRMFSNKLQEFLLGEGAGQITPPRRYIKRHRR